MGAAVREILRFLEHFDIQLTWDAADIFLSRYSINIRYILCRCIYMNILYVYIHHNPIHVCVKDADSWVFKFFFSHPFFASGISLWESALHDEWGVYDAETGRAAQLPSQGGGWSRCAAEALHDATESRKKGLEEKMTVFQQKHDLEQKMHC